MKKSFTIGRDPQNDIVISDPSDLVSRVHAVLKVDNKGHYKIVDQSSNGTYVNGIRIEKYADVPVTRKDEITFASVSVLNWDEIPKVNTAKPWIIAICSVLAALAVTAGLVLGIQSLNSNCSGGGTTDHFTTAVDSLKFNVKLAQSTIKADDTQIKVSIDGNVKWRVKVTDKDGKPFKNVQIEPASGKGKATVLITVPKNTKTKSDVVYYIEVSTEENVKPQSYMLSVDQAKRQNNTSNTPAGDTNKEEVTNNPIF